jgi:hypothetical protein
MDFTHLKLAGQLHKDGPPRENSLAERQTFFSAPHVDRLSNDRTYICSNPKLEAAFKRAQPRVPSQHRILSVSSG